MNENSNHAETAQSLVELTSEEIDQVSGGVSLLFVPIVAPAFDMNWG